MKLTFLQTSRLLGKKYVDEARRCVETHGAGGKGDPMPLAMIWACTAEYVLTCVQRELLANPNNTLAQDLRDHLKSAMQ